jgi:hypothetical protein
VRFDATLCRRSFSKNAKIPKWVICTGIIQSMMSLNHSYFPLLTNMGAQNLLFFPSTACWDGG